MNYSTSPISPYKNRTMNNSVTENLLKIKESLADGVKLNAVSKFHAIEDIQEAYNAGQRIFGESREQELKVKHVALPDDIEWHFIGHLQTNKVKSIAPYVSMIETVDSLRLLQEINKQACKIGRTIDVLLELHIAEEETKSGFSIDECRELLSNGEWKSMEGIRIRGIMMMASNTDDDVQIRNEFSLAAGYFDEFKRDYFADCDYFNERSYGMSDDYTIAQQCRSTMVRVGTRIFGARNYS